MNDWRRGFTHLDTRPHLAYGLVLVRCAFRFVGDHIAVSLILTARPHRYAHLRRTHSITWVRRQVLNG